jgi:tRNA dimethylallyltransferase
MRKKVLVIVGPTASGKTALAIKIANGYNGEIINADSMQIYKEISIGTAKPTEEEQAQARHHLIDIKSVEEDYSAAEFKERAQKIISDIPDGKLPIISGGTGLYIQSLLEEYDFEQGQNIKENYDYLIIGLADDREKIYERINARVDLMLKTGLLDEAKFMTGHKNTLAGKAIGFKELFPHIEGDATLEDVTDLLKQNSRRYAKRQLTWFRNRMDVAWFEPQQTTEIEEKIQSWLKNEN